MHKYIKETRIQSYNDVTEIIKLLYILYVHIPLGPFNHCAFGKPFKTLSKYGKSASLNWNWQYEKNTEQ